MAVAILESSGGRALREASECGNHRLLVVRMQKAPDRLPLQLRFREAEGRLPARVQLAQASVERHDTQHVRGEGEEPVPAGLAIQTIAGLGQARRMLTLLNVA